MAGPYYELNRSKLLLNIDPTDEADDEVLDSLGHLADQHIDNILKQHDEKIPVKQPRIKEDLRSAAAFYVASLFRGKRGDNDNAEFWMKQFTETINGIIAEQSIEGFTHIAHRFRGRPHAQEHEFILWDT